MNPYINDRMNRWADWVLSGRRVMGLGYPSRSAFMRLVPADHGPVEPISFEECSETDKAFCALKTVKAELAEALYLYHTTSMTKEQMALECNCCVKTFFNRIHAGHEMIQGFLNDLYAGLKLPQKS